MSLLFQTNHPVYIDEHLYFCGYQYLMCKKYEGTVLEKVLFNCTNISEIKKILSNVCLKTLPDSKQVFIRCGNELVSERENWCDVEKSCTRSIVKSLNEIYSVTSKTLQGDLPKETCEKNSQELINKT